MYIYPLEDTSFGHWSNARTREIAMQITKEQKRLSSQNSGMKIKQIAIALLFFLHGARLSREAIWGGLSHWRLHLLILSVTFLLFPILGSGVAAVLRPWLTDNLYLGILFLACLPSTVQSAVALTAMARGNVPVSICSASASTLLGVFITPLLVGIMLAGATSAQATVSLEAVGKIMLQLFFPFVFGHLLRPVIGAWVMKRQQLLKVVDQGSILLVVYTAFSGAVVGGLAGKGWGLGATMHADSLPEALHSLRSSLGATDADLAGLTIYLQYSAYATPAGMYRRIEEAWHLRLDASGACVDHLEIAGAIARQVDLRTVGRCRQAVPST